MSSKFLPDCSFDVKLTNLSDINLNAIEQNVLEKGLNFCPTVKSPNKIQLLDDLYLFCRKLRLKEFFYDLARPKSKAFDENDSERCDVKSTCSNPNYNTSKNPSNA